MSTTCLFRALKAKVGNPQRKLVLIMLADIANEHGRCWPSHQYLADRAECSRRSVINHISELEKAGFISIERRSKDNIKASNIYTILNVQNLHNEASPDVQNLHRGSETVAQGGSETVAHNTPTLFKPLNDTPTTEQLFQLFYEAYPKKVGRDEALKAWKKLKPAPTPEFTAMLITDCRERVSQGHWCTGPNKQYIPGPAPYLNQSRWEDEIIPRPEFKKPQDFSLLAREAQDLGSYL